MPITRSGYAQSKRNGSTRHWRNARLQVIAAATICGICGRDLLRKFDPIEVDHLVPIAHGGTDELTNLRAVHRSCNRQRGAASVDEVTQGGGVPHGNS